MSLFGYFLGNNKKTATESRSAYSDTSPGDRKMEQEKSPGSMSGFEKAVTDDFEMLDKNITTLYGLVADLKEGNQLAFDYFQANHALTNKLIAHNMFAIVRLEIGHSIDKVTNDAIEKKREKTGTGNFKLVCNVASSVAIMAGNVVSGGGMTSLGQVIVGSASLLAAAVNNNVKGGLKSGGMLSGAATDAHVTPIGDQTFDNAMGGNAGSSNLNSTATSTGESLGDGVDTINKVLAKVNGPSNESNKYKLTQNNTFFTLVSYGSGGTNAITYDVQNHVLEAYSKMMVQLKGEMSAWGSKPLKDGGGVSGFKILELLTADNSLDVPAGGGQVAVGMHPLTVYVLEQGLQSLIEHGTKYKNMTAGRFSRSSTLSAAQTAVNAQYITSLACLLTYKCLTPTIPETTTEALKHGPV